VLVEQATNLLIFLGHFVSAEGTYCVE
jgi:hypothetical protein